MIVTRYRSSPFLTPRYTYGPPTLRGLGAAEPPAWSIPALLGGALLVGLVGIAILEVSQGRRLGRRR